MIVLRILIAIGFVMLAGFLGGAAWCAWVTLRTRPPRLQTCADCGRTLEALTTFHCCEECRAAALTLFLADCRQRFAQRTQHPAEELDWTHARSEPHASIPVP